MRLSGREGSQPEVGGGDLETGTGATGDENG